MGPSTYLRFSPEDFPPERFPPPPSRDVFPRCVTVMIMDDYSRGSLRNPRLCALTVPRWRVSVPQIEFLALIIGQFVKVASVRELRLPPALNLSDTRERNLKGLHA